jgi:hypothetical protein
MGPHGKPINSRNHIRSILFSAINGRTPADMRASRPIFLLATVGLASALFAQIPNGDFNQWTSEATYGDPVNWKTTNALAQTFGVGPTCERGEPGSDGMGFARVINRAAGDGVVLQGKIVSSDTLGAIGFPYDLKPTTIGGRCQYDLHQYDVGQVQVSLTRWEPLANHSFTVGFGSVNFIGTSTGTWQSFSANISYLNNNIPDTAIITINAAASQLLVTDGSYLQVDELKFGFIGVGVDELANLSFSLHPSLASDQLNVTTTKPASLAVATDVTGRRVAQFAVVGQRSELNVGNLAPGRYVLEVEFKDGTTEKRSFIKE